MCLIVCLMFLIVCLMCLIRLQEEEFSDTFFGLSDYELQIRKKILMRARLLNSIDTSGPLGVSSDTPDPVEKKAIERENELEQKTQAKL